MVIAIRCPRIYKIRNIMRGYFQDVFKEVNGTIAKSAFIRCFCVAINIFADFKFILPAFREITDNCFKRIDFIHAQYVRLVYRIYQLFADKRAA